MDDDELAKQIKKYQDLKSNNKEIDVASLAMAALQSEPVNSLTPKEKRIAYFISLGFPPFGILFAVKFYTSGKNDGKHAAYVCLGLTTVAIIGLIIFSNLMFAGSGLSVDQLQQSSQQYQELLQ